MMLQNRFDAKITKKCAFQPLFTFDVSESHEKDVSNLTTCNFCYHLFLLYDFCDVCNIIYCLKFYLPITTTKILFESVEKEHKV